MGSDRTMDGTLQSRFPAIYDFLDQNAAVPLRVLLGDRQMDALEVVRAFLEQHFDPGAWTEEEIVRTGAGLFRQVRFGAGLERVRALKWTDDPLPANSQPKRQRPRAKKAKR